MGSALFALSVHHFIDSVGSDAGFASIIGLAILVLLYFAQARETASLRNRADEAARRIQQLEGRLAQLVRRPSPAAEPASVARTSAAEGPAGGATPAEEPEIGAATAAPAPPAGVAAPALTAATKLIPSSEAATAPVAARPVTAAGAARDAAAEPEREIEATAVAAAPAAAGAAGGNGAPQDRVPAPAVRQSPVQPPRRVQIRPGAAYAGRRLGSSSWSAPRKRDRVPPGLLALLGVLGVAGLVAVLLVLTSGGGSSTSATASHAANATARQRVNHPPAFNPSSVTVAVLNGTSTSGLAHRVATHLGADGYKEGTIATAADQTRTATVVAYMPAHRRDALAVAGTLKLGSASVQPIDPSTQAVACPPSTTCTAGVVVTVGADLATTQ